MRLLSKRQPFDQTNVFSRANAIRFAVLLGALALAGNAPASSKKSQPPVDQATFHSVVPLGAETFDVRGTWKGSMTLLASAENPQFEGMIRRVVGDRVSLLDPEGQPFQYYPQTITFRVTATARARLSDPNPFPVQTSSDENTYLLGLKFRVKIFHGLKQTVVDSPADLIGVPADIGYDERVFRVTADLPKVSTEDRVVLEVLSPDGERICKFHLDLL